MIASRPGQTTYFETPSCFFVLLRGEYLFEQVLERDRLGGPKKKFCTVAIREFRMDVAILY